MIRPSRLAVTAFALALAACQTVAEEAAAPEIAAEPACRPDNGLVVGAVGDVLLHTRLQQQGYGPEGFGSLWAPFVPYMSAPDIMYANMEGPTADGTVTGGRSVPDPGPVFDGSVYTSYPLFNYHPSLIPALAAAGVDIVSTANNHALDRGANGARRTIDNLEAAGMPFSGTRRDAGEVRPWSTVIEANGYRTAWLACTYDTNGVPDVDAQVLWCYRDEAEVLAEIARLDADPAIDAVFATPHWGYEYQTSPNDRQRRLGRAMIEAGASAVIGAHPHVLQPWEWYAAPNGNEGLIHYSLGNFVSNQRELPRRANIMLVLGLLPAADGDLAVVDYGFVPGVVTHQAQVVTQPVWTADQGAGSAARDFIAGLGFTAEREMPRDPAAWEAAFGFETCGG
ncbi:MAG: CapA family protein [Azospirillaceae bacterium]